MMLEIPNLQKQKWIMQQPGDEDENRNFLKKQNNWNRNQ